MPDMVVLVSNVLVIDSVVKVAYQVTSSTGVQTFGEVDLDYPASVVNANKAVEDAAILSLAAVGETIGVTDKKLTFGGRVL